jgi:hypothetical protein
MNLMQTINQQVEDLRKLLEEKDKYEELFIDLTKTKNEV